MLFSVNQWTQFLTNNKNKLFSLKFFWGCVCVKLCSINTIIRHSYLETNGEFLLHGVNGREMSKQLYVRFIDQRKLYVRYKHNYVYTITQCMDLNFGQVES